MPRELSVTEIEAIVEKHAAAAKRAQKAGFDGVEIQAVADFLLTEFLSTDSNKRQDAYGGDLKNRARFLLEVVAAVRDAVGRDYPVWVRLTVQQLHTDNGIKAEETNQVARWLEEAGVVALDLSADYFQSSLRMPWKVPGERLPRPPAAHPHGFLIPLIAQIKQVVNIPVMGVGWLNPETGEQALREDKIDMVLIGRPLLVDPEIPNKTATGRLDDIRPCIGCLMCQTNIDNGVVCTVNASVGRDYKHPILPAEKKKRVAVVGGGPAGLEAARVAALRGHEVILYEKGASLGGQLLIASLPPHKDILNNLRSHMVTQVDKSGVRVEIGVEVTAELILQTRPDAVIIATGITRCLPEIPGIDSPSVVEAADVLTGKRHIGDTVVIIGGGVIDLLERLESLGVAILLQIRAEAVQEEGLVVSTEAGAKQVLLADNVVSSTGARPNQELYQQLSGKVPEVYQVGDCVEPRRLLEAISDSFLVSQVI
jgi:thioredoxin reductase